MYDFDSDLAFLKEKVLTFISFGLVVSIRVLRVCRGILLEAWVADLICGMI